MSAQLASFETIGQQNMSDTLLVRAVAANYGTDAPEIFPQSPETSGDFSLDRYSSPDHLRIEMLESPAISTIGEHLPSLLDQEEHLAQLRESELMGDLMWKVRLSKLTGCIMRPDVWRNHKGYPKVALKAAKELGIGNSSREMHRVVHFLHLAETTGQAPTKKELAQQVDHICRNPACCSPTHTRLMSNADNNSLKDEAAKVEPMIMNGQLFYAADIFDSLPWLEETIIEDGELMPVKAISTRLGPFALRAAHPEPSVFYGERLSCDVFDSLKAPGKNTYKRPSRARKVRPLMNQRSLMNQAKYTKKTIPTQKDRYVEALKAA